MSDLKLHRKGMDHDGVLAGLDRFEVTSNGRDALREEMDAEAARNDPDGEAAREAAVFGNFDTVAEQQSLIRELRASEVMSMRAIEGLTAERNNLVAAHAELLEQKMNLEIRIARLTEDGLSVPTSLDEAMEQLFDAEAVFAAAERTALAARGQKFDAQTIRDRAEAAAIVRLVGTGGVRGQLPVPGAMSPTEAKDRLEEDADYAQVASAFRTAARIADECETDLRVATSRVETLRACVRAMSNRSPLTARAVAISRTQQ